MIKANKKNTTWRGSVLLEHQNQVTQQQHSQDWLQNHPNVCLCKLRYTHLTWFGVTLIKKIFNLTPSPFNYTLLYHIHVLKSTKLNIKDYPITKTIWKGRQQLVVFIARNELEKWSLLLGEIGWLSPCKRAGNRRLRMGNPHRCLWCCTSASL